HLRARCVESDDPGPGRAAQGLPSVARLPVGQEPKPAEESGVAGEVVTGQDGDDLQPGVGRCRIVLLVAVGVALVLVQTDRLSTGPRDDTLLAVGLVPDGHLEP